MFDCGGGESGFYAKPCDENRGEQTEEVLAHSVEEAEVLGKQGVDGLKDVLKIVGLHCRQLPRRLGVYLHVPYGMRKFLSESVRGPVTWAIFAAKLPWRWMSGLVVREKLCGCLLVDR